MTLDTSGFIRRFLLHVLPDGFHRIRHYGLLANTTENETMTQIVSTADSLARTLILEHVLIVSRTSHAQMDALLCHLPLKSSL